MAKFVPDIKTQRWIVISQSRSFRPDEHVVPEKPRVCVFCPGNETLTTKELYRVGSDQSWSCRVIPNKYPITDIHEVIIHSPDHSRNIAELDTAHVATLLSVYRSRFQAHEQDGQVMIFSNHGEHAGASLKHPHSQLVVIPRQINLDALVREPMLNIIEENTNFVTYCPDFSQWPYEVWIAPKKEGTMFGQVTDEEIPDLAGVFQQAVQKLAAKHKDPGTLLHMDGPFAYNYYIHHAKNWFIRIIPRFIHRAGFELGTGLSVNMVDPTVAAEEFRGMAVTQD